MSICYKNAVFLFRQAIITTVRRAGSNWTARFCGKNTHRYHMGYNIGYGYVNCWKCGKHSLLETIVEAANIGTGEALRLLQQLDRGQHTLEQDEVKLRKLVLPKGVGELLPAHKRYLKERGFDWKELVSLWQVAGIGLAPTLSWRLFIPVHLHGKTVSWITRAIGEATTRYIGAKKEEEKVSRRTLLYGEDYVRHSVLVVEGPTDAWKVGPGAVCTFGIDYSREQVCRLAKYENRYICFDNEKQAQKQAQQLARDLAVFPGKTSNVILDAKDAGSAGKKELMELRKLVRL